MTRRDRYELVEVCEKWGVEQEFVVHCIRSHWVIPAETAEELRLDEEDVARLQLIRELREDMGVNDEAVPIILNLLDQIYEMRKWAKKVA